MPYSQLGDMIAHLDALGVTNYQALSLLGGSHSWANWPSVKDQALTFIANGFAGVPPPPPLPTPPPGSTSKQVLNVSTRASAGVGENVIVGGFIVSGDRVKRVVLRALGPSVGQDGVNGVLADPVISLYDSGGVLIESNDNRLDLGGVVNPLLPSNPSESYLLPFFPRTATRPLSREWTEPPAWRWSSSTIWSLAFPASRISPPAAISHLRTMS